MAHIAGAGRLSINERVARRPTRSSMFERDHVSLLRRRRQRDPYRTNRRAARQRPRPRSISRRFSTRTARVEYWGGGRAAALVHTTPDGKSDLTLPANVRVYFLTGAQHSPARFPAARHHGPAARQPGRILVDAAGAARRHGPLGAPGHGAAAEPVPAPGRRHARRSAAIAPFPAIPGVPAAARSRRPRRAVRAAVPGAPGRRGWQRARRDHARPRSRSRWRPTRAGTSAAGDRRHRPAREPGSDRRFRLRGRGRSAKDRRSAALDRRALSVDSDAATSRKLASRPQTARRRRRSVSARHDDASQRWMEAALEPSTCGGHQLRQFHSAT